MSITIDNVIAGKRAAPVSGQYMDVTSPNTGAVISKVALSNMTDVETAVAAAEAAHVGWSAVTVKTRTQILMKFWHIVNKPENKAELVKLVILEHGKTEGEALGSIAKGMETVEWAQSLPQLCQGKILEVSRGVQCNDVYESVGVCASIVPFNFPIMVPMWTLPICIGMGNCLILKPSEKVPMTMHRTIDWLHEAGVPPGVVQIINGGRDAVEAICDHPRIKAVSFVGSSMVGKLVVERCHKIVNKRVLALGGAKNHLIAYPDCNIAMCANDITASFVGCSGQRCMAASVLLTVGSQPELIEQIVANAKAFTPGWSQGQTGPVIDEAARTRIVKYIDEAEKGGAKILLDGRGWATGKDHPDVCGKGSWVGPTIILHTNPADRALHEEIFGPTLSILQVKDKEEAIKVENGNPYGNAACIYTESGAVAAWFSKRFSVGMVGVNVGVPVPREPFSFGGSNDSKFGENDITGEGAMRFFSKVKKVTTKWNPPKVQDWMS